MRAARPTLPSQHRTVPRRPRWDELWAARASDGVPANHSVRLCGQTRQLPPCVTPALPPSTDTGESTYTNLVLKHTYMCTCDLLQPGTHAMLSMLYTRL